MPDPITAVVGGSAVLGFMGASESNKTANKASRRASEADAKSLAFEQQKYDDWRDTYGGIEDNLADYYSNLTPEHYEVQGLENFQKEHQASSTRIKELLAQRGLEDSGIAIASEISGAQSAAVQRATIRTQAPALAAEEKRSFLQVGLGQNPGASYSRALADKAGRDSQSAAASRAAASQATSTAIQSAGTGLTDYFAANPGTDYAAAGAGVWDL